MYSLIYKLNPIIFSFIVFSSCSAPNKLSSPPSKNENSSILKGSRKQSAQQKTSENRPIPWDKDTNPLEEDRFGFSEAKLRRQEQEYERGSLPENQLKEMKQFVHPACESLSIEQKRTCPISSIRWLNWRKIPKGIHLEASEHDALSASLNFQIMCHLAFSKSKKIQNKCPLYFSNVRIRFWQSKNIFHVVLETDDASFVSSLQNSVVNLIQ